jgi:hypothetical protein
VSTQCIVRCTLLASLVLLTSLSSAAVAEEDEAVFKGLQRAWSLQGNWFGVSADNSTGTIYAVGREGRCVQVDTDGKQEREIRLPESSGMTVRIVRLPDNGKKKALATFNLWSGKLGCFDLDGKTLWTGSDGIDDVWVDELGGGADKMIVGYNGAGGIQVLDGQGAVIWKNTTIGNVWHVCAGDVLGTGSPQVITTSATGQIHIFDATTGKRIKDLDAGCYATMVRVIRADKPGKADLILAAGSPQGADDKTVLIALGGNGSKKWSLPLAGTPSAAVVAAGKPWLSVGMQGGRVQVVDLDRREVVGSITDRSAMLVDVAWAARGAEAPWLLVAMGGNLNAFRLSK